jgi:hypothetical protein
MSVHRMENQGLGHGRDWALLPDDEAVIDWSVQPEQGLVQGPLDLEFLRGRRVSLTLDTGQVALLVCDNTVQAVYLDGGHVLDIGHGRGQVPCRAAMVFLTIGHGIEIRWTGGSPLMMGAAGPAVIGHCTLAIAGPGRFHDTFLAGNEQWDEAFILRLVRQATRSALERVLGETDLDPNILQSRLANLDPADLDEELEPLGLSCRRAALYTSAPPMELAPVEAAGQFSVPGDNGPM